MFTKKPEDGMEGGMVAAPGTASQSGSVAPQAPQQVRPASEPPAAPRPQAVAPVKKVAPGKAASTSPSLIASDLRISGDVLADGGEIQIDGAVQGNVSCKSLLVGETAVLTGGVFSAEDIVVRGKIEGTLRGVRVSLQASSEVEGDIHHKSLAIEEGAFFEGKSRREDNPMANAKPSGDTANRPSSGAAGGVVSRISPGSDGKQE